ncbi:MAG TPA: hypothetical protein VGM53_29290 [Streptosporangiaceae bacterium]|jgi:hypothetical protein
MSLSTAQDDRGHGYQAVPLPRRPGDESVLVAQLARRACPRPSRRAALYVHCLADPQVQPDLAGWYLQRGFHFYVADIRAARSRSREATLAEYFGCLDAAIRQVRQAEGNRVVLVSAHRAGAVIAALWCHERRAAGPAEALIMADPDFGPSQHWLYRLLAIGQPAAASAPRGTAAWTAQRRPAAGTADGTRLPEVLPQAQRKLRRGLDISCPVLVLSPSAVNVAVGRPSGQAGAVGHLSGRASSVPGARYRAAPPARLGPHVTSLRLASAPPGLARPGRPRPRPDQAARRSPYDELSRWLGAYLSADVRDQLLLR